jgi:hypothetical protein
MLQKLGGGNDESLEARGLPFPEIEVPRLGRKPYQRKQKKQSNHIASAGLAQRPGYRDRRLHVFDPVGPNVSTFAATPFAAHAGTYRQNLCVVGKSLYWHLRFIPTFRPAAENKQMRNAVAFNAPDGISAPLHAMHFYHQRHSQRAIEEPFPPSRTVMSDFSDVEPADASRTAISKMSANYAFFSQIPTRGHWFFFFRGSPRCLIPGRA